MRLMQPSAGEIWDRITILDLKIAHSDRQEFKDEHRLLREYYDSQNYPQLSVELINEMTRINSRLWDLEDRQRLLIKDIESQFVKEQSRVLDEFHSNAIDIIHLNDARAETVRKINVACGIDSMEKLHATH